MNIANELVGFAKANAEAAKTEDERMTWAAHHRNALAAQAEIEQLRAQLERANRLVEWMMPYIGSMCPPPNGLFDLNEHCCDNKIGPNEADNTKGRPINQRPERACEQASRPNGETT